MKGRDRIIETNPDRRTSGDEKEDELGKTQRGDCTIIHIKDIPDTYQVIHLK